MRSNNKSEQLTVVRCACSWAVDGALGMSLVDKRCCVALLPCQSNMVSYGQVAWYPGPYHTALHSVVTRGCQRLGGSSVFLKLFMGFLYLLSCFLLLESEALCPLSAVCNSASGSGSPEGRARDDRLEEACPSTSLQPDIHAGLYSGRLRCCLGRSLPSLC